MGKIKCESQSLVVIIYFAFNHKQHKIHCFWQGKKQNNRKLLFVVVTAMDENTSIKKQNFFVFCVTKKHGTVIWTNKKVDMGHIRCR